MGCNICCDCGGKFEESSAEEFAADGDEEPDYETCPHCIMKQNEEDKTQSELVAMRLEIKSVQAEVKTLRENASLPVSNQSDPSSAQQIDIISTLRTENKQLREELSASKMVDLTNDSDSDQEGKDARKRARTEGATSSDVKSSSSSKKSIWVIVKGAFPDIPHQSLVDVEVLGTYSSEENAEEAKELFLEEGGWEECGEGYHQGEQEQRIDIYESVLDA